MSQRDRILLAVVGLVAIVGGIFWFVVKPARADLASAKEQTVETQGRVDQLKTQLNKLTAKPRSKDEPPLSDELLVAKALPAVEDVPTTILQIEKAANEADVGLGTVETAEAKAYAGITGTPYTVEATGTFLDIQDFMYRLHQRVNVSKSGKLRVKGRLFAVVKADLSAEDSGEPGAAKGQVKVSISIVAFSRSAGGAAAAAAGAPAPGGTTAPTTATPTSTNTGGSVS